MGQTGWWSACWRLNEPWSRLGVRHLRSDFQREYLCSCLSCEDTGVALCLGRMEDGAWQGGHCPTPAQELPLGQKMERWEHWRPSGCSELRDRKEFGSVESGRPHITASICPLLWKVTYLGFGVTEAKWIQSPPHSKLSPFLRLITGCPWHRAGPITRSFSRCCWSIHRVPGSVWAQSRANEVLALLRPHGGRTWIRK